MTDPVAIGRLVRIINVPQKFHTLLEGESHFTDASAMIIFLLALNTVENYDKSNTDQFVYFIQLVFGGIGMGLVFGIFFCIWLYTCTNDAVYATTITFMGAYLTFFVTEFSLNCSGILAVCIYGLIMNAYGKTRLTENTERTMHVTWNFLVFCLEGLAYLICGLVFGYYCQTATFDWKFKNYSGLMTERVFYATDFFKGISFTFSIYFVRLLVFLIFMPILNMIGDKIDLKTIFFLSWSGIRGVISVILALIVVESESANVSIRLKDLALFMTIIVIIISWCLNRCSIPWLFNATGFKVISPSHMHTKNLVKTETTLYCIEKMYHFEAEPCFEYTDWNKVSELTGLKEDLWGVVQRHNQKMERNKSKLQKDKNNHVTGSDNQLLLSNAKSGKLKEAKKTEIRFRV